LAFLTIYLSENDIQTYELSTQDVTVGRQPGNSLVLNNPTVSRIHARFVHNKDADYYQVENMSATNPALLNNKVITRPVILFEKDHITIGSFGLVFSESKEIDSP